jgi:Ni2+-binding GTPase involved in maturation of urease and hydrogenase
VPKLTIAQKILAANDTIAEEIRQRLAAHRLKALNLMSSPGAGKTTLLGVSVPYTSGSASAATLARAMTVEVTLARTISLTPSRPRTVR